MDLLFTHYARPHTEILTVPFVEAVERADDDLGFAVHRLEAQVAVVGSASSDLEGKSISEVARTFNVHPATIYRYIN